MDFIAMDFETANRKRASACSLALVVVQQNRVVDSFYTLINPQMQFDPQNIRIHGITPDMVQDQPTFDRVWPHIQMFYTPGRIVTAHNAPFDVSVLRLTLDRYGIAAPRYQVIDTVKTSRQFLPKLPNHRLDTVSAALKIPLEHHHNSLADSYACARILIAENEHFGEAQTKAMMKLAKAG